MATKMMISKKSNLWSNVDKLTDRGCIFSWACVLNVLGTHHDLYFAFAARNGSVFVLRGSGGVLSIIFICCGIPCFKNRRGFKALRESHLNITSKMLPLEGT